MKDLIMKSPRFLNKYSISLFILFILGLLIRYLYIYPDNIIFGYDQVIDAISARKIIDYHDIIIQGDVNALGLNHGVLLSYFTAMAYFLGNGNPMIIAYWFLFFNATSIICVYIFSLFVFKRRSVATISAFILLISHYMILVSGWISGTTVALFLSPLFFLGFWLYKKGYDWALVLSMFILGVLIQSQMLMVYNIAAVALIWFLLKLKKPSLKIVFFSLLAFIASTSTMILTEIRSNFSSIKVLLNPQLVLDESSLPFLKQLILFMEELLIGFSSSLTPAYPEVGAIVGILIILIIFQYIFFRKTKKEEKDGLILLLIFLFSPTFMLLIGYHDTPWTLIGTVPAVAIATGYVISKLRNHFLTISVLVLIFFLNISAVIASYKKGDLFIPQELSSTLKGQLSVIDYTYQKSEGKDFAINAVTYPLYNNTYWSYHYPWYGQARYGYMPTWLGGEQLYPYNSLVQSDEKEIVFYMIIDETGAIPEVHKAAGRSWGYKYGKLIEESYIGGFSVQKFKRYN